MKDVLKTILSLRDELNQHNYRYYVLDAPTISDFEFDTLLKRLIIGLFSEALSQEYLSLKLSTSSRNEKTRLFDKYS